MKISFRSFLVAIICLAATATGASFSSPQAGIRLPDANAPQANGSIKWRVEGDGDYMAFRPTIGPDGTIYFQNVNGQLYALRPDGSVKWIFQGGYPYGPVAVGADN